MKQYLELLNNTLISGKTKDNRTSVGTISIFGTQTRYNLSIEHFPIVTTKKINFKAIVGELLWFIKGNTNIKYLVDNGINIWNEWPYEQYKKSNNFCNETMVEFINKIKTDSNFAKKWGDLGPVYGKQWRNFNGVDQLVNIINEIKVNKNSRRLIISSWNPNEINKMVLPPCHCFFQFYVNNNKLSCQLYQRSADLFLGVPFNITSYSLLTILIAKECKLELGEFIHTIGDNHIYNNHLDQVKKQLAREPKQLPKLIIKREVSSIFDYNIDDFELENYEHDDFIKAPVAV